MTKQWSRYRVCIVFFFQAEDGIRDLVRSRGLGDVYKRQIWPSSASDESDKTRRIHWTSTIEIGKPIEASPGTCLLYTSDAADERSSVDLGGRRIIKKKKRDVTERYGENIKHKMKTTTMIN